MYRTNRHSQRFSAFLFTRAKVTLRLEHCPGLRYYPMGSGEIGTLKVFTIVQKILLPRTNDTYKTYKENINQRYFRNNSVSSFDS